jgi:mannosyltransferase
MSQTDWRRQLRLLPRETTLPATAASAQAPQPWLRLAPGARVAALVALVVVAAILRVIGVTRQSLWLDEAYSVYLAAHPFPQLLAFVSSSDAHPPLYYLVLHVWMLFGQSPLTVRGLSAVASLGAVIVTYSVGRSLANSRVAFLSAMLMALSSFQVWYAQEARMYALMTLAVLVAMWAFVNACETQRMLFWVIYTCAMLAAIYLDYTAFFVYSAVFIWFLRSGWRRVYLRKPFALSSLILFLGYLPWLPSLWRQLFVFGSLTSWVSGANGSGLTGAITDLFFNRTNLLLPDSGTVATLATLASVAVAAVALWVPRHAPGYTLPAYWFGWPCALELAAEFMNRPLVIGRTIMVVQPALFLLLALAADEVWKKPRPQRASAAFWLQRLSPVILFAVFVTTNISAQVTSWNTTLKEDWRGAASLVAAHERPGDLVLFNAYFAQLPFDYYFDAGQNSRANVVEHGYQTEESLLFVDLNPSGTGIAPGPELSSYARVWVVLSHAGAPDEQAVPLWLRTHDRLVRSWQLVGVTVRLYQIPDGSPGGGP